MLRAGSISISIMIQVGAFLTKKKRVKMGGATSGKWVLVKPSLSLFPLWTALTGAGLLVLLDFWVFKLRFRRSLLSLNRNSDSLGRTLQKLFISWSSIVESRWLPQRLIENRQTCRRHEIIVVIHTRYWSYVSQILILFHSSSLQQTVQQGGAGMIYLRNVIQSIAV